MKSSAITSSMVIMKAEKHQSRGTASTCKYSANALTISVSPICIAVLIRITSSWHVSVTPVELCNANHYTQNKNE